MRSLVICRVVGGAWNSPEKSDVMAETLSAMNIIAVKRNEDADVRDSRGHDVRTISTRP
ncbi:hypothetical protein CSIRO_1130 [Bradyrhizobiaceae bacterium SG-6C]|nr:hypothetical protein CSIRO_1130 [Bradyrhizobiaceae bacterium SG-6C]